MTETPPAKVPTKEQLQPKQVQEGYKTPLPGRRGRMSHKDIQRQASKDVNVVVEKTVEGKKYRVMYNKAYPQGRVFIVKAWNDVGFAPPKDAAKVRRAHHGRVITGWIEPPDRPRSPQAELRKVKEAERAKKPLTPEKQFLRQVAEKQRIDRLGGPEAVARAAEKERLTKEYKTHAFVYKGKRYFGEAAAEKRLQLKETAEKYGHDVPAPKLPIPKIEEKTAVVTKPVVKAPKLPEPKIEEGVGGVVKPVTKEPEVMVAGYPGGVSLIGPVLAEARKKEKEDPQPFVTTTESELYKYRQLDPLGKVVYKAQEFASILPFVEKPKIDTKPRTATTIEMSKGQYETFTKLRAPQAQVFKYEKAPTWEAYRYQLPQKDIERLSPVQRGILKTDVLSEQYLGTSFTIDLRRYHAEKPRHKQAYEEYVAAEKKYKKQYAGGVTTYQKNIAHLKSLSEKYPDDPQLKVQIAQQKRELGEYVEEGRKGVEQYEKGKKEYKKFMAEYRKTPERLEREKKKELAVKSLMTAGVVSLAAAPTVIAGGTLTGAAIDLGTTVIGLGVAEKGAEEVKKETREVTTEGIHVADIGGFVGGVVLTGGGMAITRTVAPKTKSVITILEKDPTKTKFLVGDDVAKLKSTGKFEVVESSIFGKTRYRGDLDVENILKSDQVTSKMFVTQERADPYWRGMAKLKDKATTKVKDVFLKDSKEAKLLKQRAKTPEILKEEGFPLKSKDKPVLQTKYIDEKTFGVDIPATGPKTLPKRVGVKIGEPAKKIIKIDEPLTRKNILDKLRGKDTYLYRGDKEFVSRSIKQGKLRAPITGEQTLWQTYKIPSSLALTTDTPQAARVIYRGGLQGVQARGVTRSLTRPMGKRAWLRGSKTLAEDIATDTKGYQELAGQVVDIRGLGRKKGVGLGRYQAPEGLITVRSTAVKEFKPIKTLKLTTRKRTKDYLGYGGRQRLKLKQKTEVKLRKGQRLKQQVADKRLEKLEGSLSRVAGVLAANIPKQTTRALLATQTAKGVTAATLSDVGFKQQRKQILIQRPRLKRAEKLERIQQPVLKLDTDQILKTETIRPSKQLQKLDRVLKTGGVTKTERLPTQKPITRLERIVTPKPISRTKLGPPPTPPDIIEPIIPRGPGVPKPPQVRVPGAPFWLPSFGGGSAGLKWLRRRKYWEKENPILEGKKALQKVLE